MNYVYVVEVEERTHSQIAEGKRNYGTQALSASHQFSSGQNIEVCSIFMSFYFFKFFLFFFLYAVIYFCNFCLYLLLSMMSTIKFRIILFNLDLYKFWIFSFHYIFSMIRFKKVRTLLWICMMHIIILIYLPNCFGLLFNSNYLWLCCYFLTV